MRSGMAELTPGSSWGPFRIASVIGRGPNGVVYRAAKTDDPKPVCLKIFDAGLDAPTLKRIEDDTRRMIGLSHPNVLRVTAVGREGATLYVVSELFEGRSLRVFGTRSRRDLADVLLKAARGVGAAWMRLLLHRNLKPENVLVSVGGDVKLADFGQFRDATPYWSPERKANQTPDLRGDLYSLGAVFREIIPDGDADLDALLRQMTRVETFERVQMVEDVISRLEAWLSKHPVSVSPPPTPESPAPPAAPAPPAPVAAVPPPDVPPPPPSMPDPALDSARSSILGALDAISHQAGRIPAPAPSPSFQEPRWEPPPQAPPPPPPPPLEPKWELELKPPPPPPPKPRPVVVAPPPPPPPPEPPPPPRPPKRRRSPVLGALKLLFWLGIVVAAVAVRMLNKSSKEKAAEQAASEQRSVDIKRSIEETFRKTRDAMTDGQKKADKARADEWAAAKAAILKLDSDMKSEEALRLCETFIAQHVGPAPADAQELRRTLRAWVTLVSQAEQMRKYGADKRAFDSLKTAGETRERDVQAIVARWTAEDWTKTKAALDKAVTDKNPYGGLLEVDRFLKKPHEGGKHRKDAEFRKLAFQADIDWAEVADRVDTLKVRAPAEAVAALEAFLAKPHQGGTHRDEVLQQLEGLKEEAKLTIFSGRLSVARMATSPSGKRIAFTSDGVRVLDIATKEELWTAPVKSLLRGLAFGSDDRLLTAMSNKLTVWNLAEKKEHRSFTPPTNVFIVAVAMKPDGRTVLAAVSDGTLLVWDADKEDPPAFRKAVTTGAITIATNADGSRVAVAHRDKSLRVHPGPDGTDWTWQGPPVTVSALALSPDGTRVLAGSSSGMVTYWTAASGEAGPALFGHQGSVTAAAISPDGSILATGGNDYQIRLSSPKDGSTIKLLTGHRGRISSLSFIPGALVSSSGDGSVRLWPLK